MVLHSRISVSWVWAVLGRGCLMRSRHCRMSIMITPIRITQTTNPPMMRISCQSTGINAKRHAWLKSRLFGSTSETTNLVLVLFPFSLLLLSIFLFFRKFSFENCARFCMKSADASARDCLTTRMKFAQSARAEPRVG